MSIPTTVHVPVLRQPILGYASELKPRIIFDGTLGGGGHALAFSEVIGPGGIVIAADRDSKAVQEFRDNFGSLVSRSSRAIALSDVPLNDDKGAEDPIRYSVHHASYHQLGEILTKLELPAVDMILLDLGLSSDQLADDARGFSFRAQGELDLRFDTSEGEAAWEVLQSHDETDIANILYRYGDERFSRRIAAKVCQQRKTEPIRTAQAFRDLIMSCVPGSRHGRIDPATRSFQALRIYVNDELQILSEALAELPKLLSIGGLFQVISFHSLEDRLVKNAFRDTIDLEVVTRKPVVADEAEVATNSRSRSAKLRVARRIEVSEEDRARVRSLAEYQRHSHF